LVADEFPLALADEKWLTATKFSPDAADDMMDTKAKPALRALHTPQ
jgi:hypothetical protein